MSRVPFEEVWKGGEWEGWRYREKLPSGMTLEYAFYDIGEVKGRVEINPELVVYRKRSERWKELGVVTGRDGAYTLARARTVHRAMEKFVLASYFPWEWPNVVIRVAWDDLRCRDIYARGLVPEGYHFQGNELVKALRKNGVDRIDKER